MCIWKRVSRCRSVYDPSDVIRFNVFFLRITKSTVFSLNFFPTQLNPAESIFKMSKNQWKKITSSRTSKKTVFVSSINTLVLDQLKLFGQSRFSTGATSLRLRKLNDYNIFNTRDPFEVAKIFIGWSKIAFERESNCPIPIVFALTQKGCKFNLRINFCFEFLLFLQLIHVHNN